MFPYLSITFCSWAVMIGGALGYGWGMVPEPAELKLLRVQAGLSWSIPVRALPPDTKIIECVMMWVGGPGGQPAVWCPPMLLRPTEQPPIPTS